MIKLERYARPLSAIGLIFVGLSVSSVAGGRTPRRVHVETRSVVVQPVRDSVYPGLGTFYPTPMLSSGGNAPAGYGYSPLGIYGETSTTLYGPLSAFRSNSAPLTVYSRGYDGRALPVEATSFSYPNYPPASRVVYPTRANVYTGFRAISSPPWQASAINWIDQN